MRQYLAFIIAGERRGSKLGFPTINLKIDDFKIKHGVYLVKAVFADKKNACFYKKDHLGLLHFGKKKTFNGLVSIELYIKEDILDISKKDVIIRIVKKIRDVKKFANAEELKEQINKDLKILQDWNRES